MALTSPKTIDGVLTSTSYTNTINSQTERIADAHEVIQAKARQMLLKVKAGQGDAKPANDTLLLDTHKIMDTASAINTIVVDPTPAIVTIDSGNFSINGATVSFTDEVDIPKGYYTENGSEKIPIKGNITMGAASHLDLTIEGDHTAGAASIEVSVTGTKLNDGATGFITDEANKEIKRTISLQETSKGSEKSVSNLAVASYKAADNINYVSLTPEQGFYTKDAWKTDIAYAPLTGEQLINVVENTSTGENFVETLTIPAGYYPQDVTVQPKINGIAEDKVINVRTTIDTLRSQSASLTIPTGYNYYSGTASYTIQNASTTAATAQTPDPSPNLTSVKADGTIEIKTPGWIPAGTYGAAYGNLAALAKADITNASTTGTADVTLNVQKSIITIPSGKQTAGGAVTKIYNVRDVSLGSPDASTSNKNGVALTTQRSSVKVGGNDRLGLIIGSSSNDSGWYDVNSDKFITDIPYQGNKTGVNPTFSGKTASVSYTVPAGYYPGTTTITGSADMALAATPSLTVTANSSDAVTVGTTATNGYFPVSAVITGQTTYGTSGYITTAGLAAATASSTVIGKIAAGSHTIDTAVSQNTKSTTQNGVAAGNYYVKCATTTGYQTASNTYIDLGKSTLTPTSITFNSTTRKFEGSVTPTVGYQGTTTPVSLESAALTVGTAGDIALTTAQDAGSKSISAGTYYPSASTISVSSTTARIAGAGTATGKTTNSNLSDTTILGNLTGDTTYSASNNKFISSVTVVVSDIISALAAI